MMEEASCLLHLPTHIFAPGSGKEVESMFWQAPPPRPNLPYNVAPVFVVAVGGGGVDWGLTGGVGC